MNITVFCSQYEVAEKYQDAAKIFAQLIAENHHALVFGGGDEGLMHIIADGVHEKSGRVIGVIREPIQHKAYKNADEMYVVKDAKEMNLGLIERGDVIVVLVGGVGTLNEITEVLRMKKNGQLDKPIVVLNTDHFFEGLKTQLSLMRSEGFIQDDVAAAIYFADTPQLAMEYITTHGN